MRMFQAACPASHRPGLRPTRGSGLGAVIETMGVTGGGITAGGGGGGVGFAPEIGPPAASAVGGVCGAAACGAPRMFINVAAARSPATSVPVIHLTFFIKEAPFNLSSVLLIAEHFVHDADFDRLIREDVRGKLINDVVLRGAVCLEEIVDHVDRALMVTDHSLQEQPVELGTSGLVELRHLFIAKHAGHQHV